MSSERLCRVCRTAESGDEVTATVCRKGRRFVKQCFSCCLEAVIVQSGMDCDVRRQQLNNAIRALSMASLVNEVLLSSPNWSCTAGFHLKPNPPVPLRLLHSLDTVSVATEVDACNGSSQTQLFAQARFCSTSLRHLEASTLRYPNRPPSPPPTCYLH